MAEDIQLSLCIRPLHYVFDSYNPLPQPAHHIDRHAVARRLAARAVRGPVPATPGHVGVIVREALQELALARGQPPDGPDQRIGLLRPLAAG